MRFNEAFKKMHCELLQDVEVAGHIFESFIKSLILKVNKFQNESMKSSLLPKYGRKIVRISALLSVARYRAEILAIFCSYFGRNDVFIKSFRFLLTFSTIYVDTCIDHLGQIPSLECQASIRLKMSSEKNETTRVYALC